ncbi:MAG: 30S ribosomal protein S7 [Planctomycetes bacterium SM23_32]|nr:MAG: 30S ribosomal protein S7 [Planctomycetes bacterium SM23_32]
MSLNYEFKDEYLEPDPRYKSKLASKFINCLMREGKTSVARRIFYKAMDLVTERLDRDDPVEVFETALGNVAPIIEVRSRRIGGMTYQVPSEVTAKRRVSLAIRWVIEAARNKKGRPMYLRLADELTDAYRRQGTAYERRENTHKMAEANRAFAHFGSRR